MRNLVQWVVWQVRFAGALVISLLLRRDASAEFVFLAQQAAHRRDTAGFLRAIRRSGDPSRFDEATVARVALYHQWIGDKSESARLFITLAPSTSQSPEVLKCYGNYLAHSGRVQEGVAYLERGLKAAPGDSVALDWLGIAYRDLGHLDRARECLEASIGMQPQPSGESYMALAFVASDQGRWEEAAGLWRKGASLLSEDATIWYNLGNSLCHTQHWREAISAFRRSLRLGWSNPQAALYGVALGYWHLGSIRKARRYCNKALQREPGYDLALGLKATIEEANSFPPSSQGERRAERP